MGRMSFVLRRLVLLVPTAMGVTIITFFMVHLIPGNPAVTILGQRANPTTVAALDKQLGLNQPLIEQYWLFIDQLFHGNLGTEPVLRQSGLQPDQQPPSRHAVAAVYAAVIAIVISVPLATLAASRKDAVRDHIVRVVPLIGLGLPAFWFGLILQTWLGSKLRLFPVTGYGSGFSGHLQSMFLPALTVAVALSPVLIRSLRASMLNVLGAEFITTARAKGVPAHRLLVRHVLRNAVIPAVTVLGINIGYLIGGTLIVEQVFAIPGLGSLMINAIFERDFTVIHPVALFYGVLVVLVNLLTDVAYVALDPRVRFDA